MPGGFVPTLDKGSAPIVKPKSVRETLPAIGVAAFAAFGGILFGYDTGTINGILNMNAFNMQFGEYYDNIPTNIIGVNSDAPKPGYALSTSNTSKVVSILSAGTFFGALFGAPIADFLGRRWGLQVALAVFCLGVALQMAASALPLFTAGRFVAGLGVGIISTIVPAYQSETAPRWIRGACVSGYQWAITIGLLLSAIVNESTKNRPNSGAYRVPIGVQFAYAVFMSAGLFFLPESPRWFVRRGQPERAAKSLAYLNSTDIDDPVVRAELADIQTNLEIEKTNGSGSYADCFSSQRNVRTRTLVGIFLQGWQQLTGINFIFYYGTRFFESTGAKNPFLFTIASNVVNVLATLPGMYMMERVGRRSLLIYGALWMFICELIVAVVGTASPVSNQSAQRSAVAFVCIYVAGFAATWGPAAWVVCGEIFPLNIRAKALSMCTASNWAWNWAIGYATPYLVDQGPGKAGLGPKVFFIWTATCLGCLIFAFFCIVETKGLSLEEVDELYATTTPRLSAKANAEMRRNRNNLEAAAGRAHSDEAATADQAKEDIMTKTADA